MLAPAWGPLGAGDMVMASMAVGAAGLVLEGTAGVMDVGCNGENGAFQGPGGGR